MPGFVGRGIFQADGEAGGLKQSRGPQNTIVLGGLYNIFCAEARFLENFDNLICSNFSNYIVWLVLTVGVGYFVKVHIYERNHNIEILSILNL